MSYNNDKITKLKDAFMIIDTISTDNIKTKSLLIDAEKKINEAIANIDKESEIKEDVYEVTVSDDNCNPYLLGYYTSLKNVATYIDIFLGGFYDTIDEHTLTEMFNATTQDFIYFRLKKNNKESNRTTSFYSFAIKKKQADKRLVKLLELL